MELCELVRLLNESTFANNDRVILVTAERRDRRGKRGFAVCRQRMADD